MARSRAWARRKLGAEKEKERRHPPDQLREILALKTLQAHRLARARHVFAWEAGEGLHVAQDIAPGKVGRRRGLLGRGMNDLDDAAVDDEKRVARIARGIDRLALAQMTDAGQLADGLQLQELEARAKGKEILVEHSTL
jgi:hypothetical protein